MIPRILNSVVSGMPVTLLIMAAVSMNSGTGLLAPSYFMKLFLHPVSVWRNQEYYRWLTADLVHNDVVHLVLNEFLLYFVCGTLERYLRATVHAGSLKYAVIYLSSMLTGSALVTVINRKDFEYSSAGASGSIVGCMFSYMLLQPHEPGFFLPGLGAVNNMFSALIVIIGLIVYQVRSKNPMINHELHFFGALGGMAATLLLFHAQLF
ncbi:rhomboid family intramembrane serine protease [Mucilaginibacter sp. Bleaf8]|uniref:rhomboid family intramembrane serine protease n=1 Tax=Mucilaginibacter sp. Bleaf8 TaxID=2834430 RepID=UPI001BCFD967|nr:rhomboid family intramembrane serine protease [Mucilaginibacter sp. Bleaf8]MBS7565547.1 rhomboid family intramembrane serine protease [Mucilaginibacter sp. Bleaf8]